MTLRFGLFIHRIAYTWLIPAVFLCVFVGETASHISFTTLQLDRHIETRLKEQNLTPSKRSSDAEFLRRVHLDLSGKIPSADEVLEFLKDGSQNKREKKIDRLLESEPYVRYWERLWMNWLVGRGATDVDNLRAWVNEALAANMPYTQFVTGLISAEGDVRENGAVEYQSSSHVDPIGLTSSISRLFLGLPMQCAQCHDHKTEEWYQEDFYGIAAFFVGSRRVGVYSEPEPDGSRREISHVVTKTTGDPIWIPGADTSTTPRFPDGKLYSGPPDQKRQALAKWMTRKDNPYFATAIVNRIWAHFMGKGFVEPLDGFGEEHPPSDPELLNLLAEDFIATGYDLQYLIRTIMNSQAYQRTSETNDNNKDDDTYYSHAYIKPLDAEQFFYSMLQATGFERVQKRRAPERFEQMKREYLERFVYLLDNGENEEIEAFNGTVPQALMMINGSMVNDSADSKRRGSMLGYIFDRSRTLDERLERMYLTALSRLPTLKEKAYFKRYLDRSLYRNKDLAYGDLYWALLNSAEFALNH